MLAVGEPFALDLALLEAARGEEARREEFKSAWSEPLKAAVRSELLQLFEKAPA